MKAPLFTVRALEILAERPDGRVELMRQRTRAEHQRRHMRAEIETQATRLGHLEALIADIDRLIGKPSAEASP